MTWLPEQFVHPLRVDVDAAHHVRPIAGSDVDLDMIAVMGSQPRLFSIYGESWGWPPADMTREADLEDLERHAEEMLTHESFNYALFDEEESRLLGCLYIDQPDDAEHDAVVSWWVVDDVVGTPLEAAFDAFASRWLAEIWPFRSIRFGVWSGE